MMISGIKFGASREALRWNIRDYDGNLVASLPAYGSTDPKEDIAMHTDSEGERLTEIAGVIVRALDEHFPEAAQ